MKDSITRKIQKKLVRYLLNRGREASPIRIVNYNIYLGVQQLYLKVQQLYLGVQHLYFRSTASLF